MKLIRKRTISSIITACLLFSLLHVPTAALPSEEASAVDNLETPIQTFEQFTQDCAILDYVDEEVIRAAGHINRLPEEDLYSYVFENADGSRTAYIMSEPVKYIDNTTKENP